MERMRTTVFLCGEIGWEVSCYFLNLSVKKTNVDPLLFFFVLSIFGSKLLA